MKITNNKTEKDYWIEMSIREIRTQAHFAELAYRNIDPKAARGTDVVFSSIHSFLSHCAMVSKMLKANDRKEHKNCLSKLFDRLLIPLGMRNRPTEISSVLGIGKSSVIHKRKFRNHLEHYDERLKQWIGKFANGANIGTHNIGPKSKMQIPNLILVSHYDPSNSTFTFVNKDFDLSVLYNEARRIEGIADSWVKATESGVVKPPYDRSTVNETKQSLC